MSLPGSRPLTLRAWQDWEAGNRRMHAGLWALYLLRTGQHPAAPLLPMLY
jgi:hypothetical protein